MHRPGPFVAILVLAFLGMADSWYLAQSAYTNTALTCNIGGALDGCNTVEQSAYARLFGVPLGAYGFAFYCLAFALAAAALFYAAPRIRKALFWWSVIGAIASLIFIFIQLFLIKAICVYCFGSAFISFIICYLAYRHRRAPGSPQPVVEPWVVS